MASGTPPSLGGFPPLESAEVASDARARQLRLGVIGTGLAVERLHWPALRQMPERFAITAFANHTRPKAEAFARLAGLDMQDYHAHYADLLRRADVDAVLIALPIPLLYPATRAALEAGKDVICEKPAGADMDQARQFLELERQFPNRVVLIAENFFYRDDVRLARSLLDAGAIGRLHLMSWRWVSELVPREGQFSGTPWRIVPEYRGGPFLDACVHNTAQIRMLCGEVDEVHGYVQDANPTMGGPSDLVLNLRFASSAIGNFTGGFPPMPLHGETNEMRMYGSDGVLVISTMGGARRLEVVSKDGRTQTFAPETDGGYVNQLRNFYEAVVFGEPVVGTIAQSVLNLAIILRGLDSAERGAPVKLAGAEDMPALDGVPLWRARGSDALFDARR
jgi:predicted dehydrogenase